MKFFLRFLMVLALVLVVAALAAPAFAAPGHVALMAGGGHWLLQIPTPEAVTPISYTDGVNGTISIIQGLGVMGLIAFAIIAIRFGPALFRRFLGGSR